MDESILAIQKTIVDLDINNITKVVEAGLNEGILPEDIIKYGIGHSMTEVGKKFETGEFFLADLILAGEIVKEAMEPLSERLNPAKAPESKKIILAAVKGDMHNLGKDIVGMMLSVAGFEIVDLGVDVHEDKIIKTIKETGAKAIGLTMLLTPATGSLKEVVDACKRDGIRDKVKIVIGGAACNDEVRKEVGADVYGEDAIKAVTIFETIYNQA